MNLNFPPKLNLKLPITEKRYKTLLLERNRALVSDIVAIVIAVSDSIDSDIRYIFNRL